MEQAAREQNGAIRLGIISGEFPDGLFHVKNLHADFYFPTTLFGRDRWLLHQLDKGYANLSEIARRGKEVETPPGVSLHPERGWRR